MPAALEHKLKKEAKKEGLKGKHKDAYVYGTLRKTGWKPNREKKLSEKIDELIELETDWKGVFSKPDDQLSPADAKKRNALLLGGSAANAGIAYKNLQHEPHPIGRRIYKTAIGAGIFTAGAATKGLADAHRRSKQNQGFLLSEKLDQLIEFGVNGFKNIKEIGTSPLGRAMIKQHNKAREAFIKSKDRYSNSKKLKKLLEDNAHLLKFSAKLDELIKFGLGSYLEEHGNEYLKALNKPRIGKWTGSQLLGAGLGGGIAAGTGVLGINKYKKEQEAQGKPITRGGYARASLWPLSSKIDDLINFADPRLRNDLGEFSGQQEGVADPNAMAKTYLHPVIKKAAGFGGLAFAGGALGSVGGQAGKDIYGAVKNLLAKKKVPKV